MHDSGDSHVDGIHGEPGQGVQLLGDIGTDRGGGTGQHRRPRHRDVHPGANVSPGRWSRRGAGRVRSPGPDRWSDE